VQISKGRDNFFVNRLKAAMEGLGTDDKTLIRVVASRAERDLQTINQEWERQFASLLETTVAVSLVFPWFFFENNYFLLKILL